MKQCQNRNKERMCGYLLEIKKTLLEDADMIEFE